MLCIHVESDSRLVGTDRPEKEHFNNFTKGQTSHKAVATVWNI